MPAARGRPRPGLESAVAAQLHQRLSRLGKRLPTPFDLEDLIVDDDTRAALYEIAAAARQRRHIRQAFKLRGAAGISVLFSGHPGVGKTMSGTVLAKRLGLDIYEIDLSQVMSKWLGETEKNLGDLFDAAEPGHVVLLFNEADSLFGKRTSDVKNSNDRYANMETNYLLQRLERFGGVAILTTNLTSAIDQAFKRRFTYDVFFSFPSPDMRAELWRRTLPRDPGSPPPASIDFDALADRYELSGGFIKVACERAAYVAGGGGVEIDEPLLRGVDRAHVPRARQGFSAVGPAGVGCADGHCLRCARRRRRAAPRLLPRARDVPVDDAVRAQDLRAHARGPGVEQDARGEPGPVQRLSRGRAHCGPLCASAELVSPLRVFFFGCVVVAGAYGGATVNKKILFVQAIPAALGLVATLLSR